MKKLSRACLAMVMLPLLSSFSAMGQGSAIQKSDVIGQSDAGPIVSPDGAMLVRLRHGLTASLNMPTPPPGSYNYPAPNAFQDTVLQGHPEVFTGWIFIFNSPENCTDPCDLDDIGIDNPAKGGAYNFAGHVVGGPNMQLTGHIAVGETPFAPSHAPLSNPSGAEVHLAVAPHGTLQPDQLPGQITLPIGGPADWWLAFFKPAP